MSTNGIESPCGEEGRSAAAEERPDEMAGVLARVASGPANEVTVEPAPAIDLAEAADAAARTEDSAEAAGDADDEIELPQLSTSLKPPADFDWRKLTPLAIGQHLDPNASDRLQATASFFDHGPGDRIPEEEFDGTVSPDHFQHLVPIKADPEDDHVLEGKVARKDFVEFAVNELGQGLEDSREYKAATKLKKSVFLRIFRNLNAGQQHDFFYYAHAGGLNPTFKQRREIRYRWIRDLLTFPDLTLQQIADRVGVDEKTVRNVRDKMPDFANRNFPDGKPPRRAKKTEALVEQARQLRGEGHSLQVIATKTGKSVSTISRWSNKPGTPDSKGERLADPGDVLSISPSGAPIAETVNSTATSFASTSSTPDGPTGTRTISPSVDQATSPDSNSVHKALNRAIRLFDDIEGSLAPEDRRIFWNGIRERIGTRLDRLSDTESGIRAPIEQPASIETSQSENEWDSFNAGRGVS